MPKGAEAESITKRVAVSIQKPLEPVAPPQLDFCLKMGEIPLQWCSSLKRGREEEEKKGTKKEICSK